jgi:hypothetical protein
MSEASNDRRRPRSLSAEMKWEIFLQITAGEISQAEAARKWQVDVSTVVGGTRHHRPEPSASPAGSAEFRAVRKVRHLRRHRRGGGPRRLRHFQRNARRATPLRHLRGSRRPRP